MQGAELPARSRGLHLIGAAGGDAVLITHGLCARTAQSAAVPQSALLARRGVPRRPLWQGCRAGRAPQNFAPILRPQHNVPSARALTTDERPTAAVLPGAAAPNRSCRQELQLERTPYAPARGALVTTLAGLDVHNLTHCAWSGCCECCSRHADTLLRRQHAPALLLQAGAHFDCHHAANEGNAREVLLGLAPARGPKEGCCIHSFIHSRKSS